MGERDMTLWQAWTDLLQGILHTLSVDWRPLA